MPMTAPEQIFATTAPPAVTRGPALPAPAGPISELILGRLAAGGPGRGGTDLGPDDLIEPSRSLADPLADDDLHLALYVCFELHYRSYAGLDEDWEWDPGLLAIRRALEEPFIDALAEAVPGEQDVDPERVGELLFEIEAADDGPPLSRHLETRGTLEQFREIVVHRSAYQLKEADPHSWAIPRLTGPAKAALVEVQSDEYGGGRADRVHSTLFAKTMRGLGLDDREGVYLDRLPGFTLATVNLMSSLGLRHRRRGAIIGHLAMFEMTSARPNRRYGNGLRRLGYGCEVTDFYDEHVEADAAHENIAAYDMAGGLARSDPELAADILFGARALLAVEQRFASRLLSSWERGQSSLRRPLQS